MCSNVIPISYIWPVSNIKTKYTYNRISFLRHRKFYNASSAQAGDNVKSKPFFHNEILRILQNGTRVKRRNPQTLKKIGHQTYCYSTLFITIKFILDDEGENISNYLNPYIDIIDRKR